MRKNKTFGHNIAFSVLFYVLQKELFYYNILKNDYYQNSVL